MSTLELQSPFRTDWPWRFVVVPVAHAIDSAWRRLFSLSLRPDPHPLAIAATIVFLYDIVALFAAWRYDVLWPVPGIRSLSQDHFGLGLLVLFPLAAALAFSFYQNVYPSLRKLIDNACIEEHSPGSFDAFMARLAARYNERRKQVVIPLAVVAVGASLAIFTPIEQRPGWIANVIPGPPSWASGSSDQLRLWIVVLPVGFQLWLAGWALMAWFALCAFAWKALDTWLAIRRLALDRSFSLTIQEHHEDEYCGLGVLTSLWLRVHFMIVIVGVYIFGFAATADAWSWPAVSAAIAAYAVLAPVLFVGPFLVIHRRMEDYRRQQIQRALNSMRQVEMLPGDAVTSALGASPERQVLLAEAAYCRTRYDRARVIPTWPFSTEVVASFASSYLFPAVLSSLSVLPF